MSSITDIMKASVRSEGVDYNKFDFQKGNNFARILIPNPNIAQAYVHSVYRSEAQMVQDDKGRLKADWESNTYAGTFHCTGDFETVSKNPTFGDPENCAACASLHSGPRVAGAPKKQFALNVFRYQTKPNSFEVIGDAITVELWKHGNDRNIAPIVTAVNETEKPISHLDFLIETDGSAFKKLQIQCMHPAIYGKDGKGGLKANVVAAMDQLYSNETLLAAIGEKVSEEEMANNIRAAVSQATQGQAVASPAAGGLFVPEPAPATPVSALSVPDVAPAEDLVKIDVGSINDLL